jgi:hypothetical protein
VELRDSEPVRRVNNGDHNIIGRFASRKTKRAIQYESMLEFSYVVWHEWNPQVLEFYDQPLQIPLGGSGSPCRGARFHIPDFLVVWPDQITLEEVKPKARLQQNPHLQDRCEQARAWAAARGLHYVVLTEDDLPPPPALGNLMFLATFRVPPPALPKFEVRLLDRIAEAPGLTVSELVGGLAGADPRIVLPCVWHLVFAHRLAVDLSNERCGRVQNAVPRSTSPRREAEMHAVRWERGLVFAGTG